MKWPFAWKWRESPEKMVANWTPPNQLPVGAGGVSLAEAASGMANMRRTLTPAERELSKFRARHAGDPLPFAPLRERREP